MNYENFKQGFDKPTIITAQQFGTKVSVELDHSDTNIDELFDAFETICIGLGYHADSWKSWIMDRADEYREEEFDKNYSFEFPESYTADDFKRDEVKQSIKDGLDRYRATKEDEDEFSNDGGFDGKPHFDWHDEDDLVWGSEEEDEQQWPEPNDELKKAAEQHKKSMKAAPKKRKKKSVEDWENEIDLGGGE